MKITVKLNKCFIPGAVVSIGAWFAAHRLVIVLEKLTIIFFLVV